jgi:carbonic anhydrase
MNRIIQGIQHFQTNIFPAQRALFERLASGQHPEALIVACSDSRVSLDLITQTAPGDLFVCRNAGNIVPPHGRTDAVAASIEYALTKLPIQDIVVCGHSDCGAMKGLLTPQALNDVPQVQSWLSHARGALHEFEHHGPGIHSPEALAKLTKLNIKLQLAHLQTYPRVSDRLRNGSLRLHGWFYQIEAGEVHVCGAANGAWLPLCEAVSVNRNGAGRLEGVHA